MRITVGRLKKLIEATWTASAPARFNLPDVTVDAESSVEAGKKAAAEYGKQGARGIDPLTISVEPLKEPPTGKPRGMPASTVGLQTPGWDPDAFEEAVTEVLYVNGDTQSILDWVYKISGSESVRDEFEFNLRMLSMAMDDSVTNIEELEDAYHALEELRAIAREKLGITGPPGFLAT